MFTADASPTTPSTRRLFGLWRIRNFLPALALAIAGIGALIAFWSREGLLRYLLSIFGLAITVVMLEVLGLVGLVGWGDLFGPRAGELGSLGTQRLAHLDKKGTTYQDLASSWGMRSDPIPFHYRTDRYGFRNHVDRPTADVVLVGDSILVAALVPFEQTVAAVLEQLSGRTVMQAALIGLAPQEQHNIFWDAGLDPRGRHVVQFIYEGNDLLDSFRFRTAGAGGNAQPRRTFSNELWNLLANATDRGASEGKSKVCTIDGQLYAFGWTRNSFAGFEGEIPFITQSLERFAQRIREAGGRYSVVFVPKKLRVLAELCLFPKESEISDVARQLGPLRSELTAWAAKAGIGLLDLTDPLTKSARDGRIPWFWGDTHWNVAGHAVAAQMLNDWTELQPTR